MARRQLLWMVYSCALATSAAADPSVQSGSRVHATLVRCDGVLDCWLARRALPAGWLAPHKSITIADVAAQGAWTAATDARDANDDMAVPTLVALGRAQISGGRGILPLSISTDALAPGHYVGTVRISGTATDDGGQPLTTADVPLDLRVRTGPLGPVLWLLFGVLTGLFLRWWTSKGERLARCLAELDTLTRIIAGDPEHVRAALEPLLRAAREARARTKLDALEASIAAIEAKRTALLQHEIGLEAASSREPAPNRVPFGLATAPLWFTQHVAGRLVRILLVLGAVTLGFKTLYCDGGATYGATPLFDGLALFVWGLGAEISTRSFGDLGRVLTPALAAPVTPPARSSSEATLPDDIAVRPRAPTKGPESPQQVWPGAFLQLAELSARGLEGDGVKIGVIDTGVATEASQPRLVHDRIERHDVRGGNGDDANDHGTYMVGILASDVGITKSKICSIRALDAKGSASAADLVRGIDKAIAERCDVISISAAQRDADGELAAAIGRARTAGIVVVAAIRSENPEGKAYPAAIAGVVAVTPSDASNRLVYREPPAWVCVGAPGVEIPTYSRTKSVVVEGSSPATAIVAGICARLLGAHTGDARKAIARELDALLSKHGADRDGGKLLQSLATANAIKGA